ncbi:hypothetical protein VP01_708g3 [Puccinia sorghi]|uniref:Uncharacterized protein n=1 Tax=Puccinia sorghi TaxID=27349 RepID=A0A0L6UDK6_9BASI|nr:hypothetical protein VP01_708g3 [Puccinia sorghi]
MIFRPQKLDQRVTIKLSMLVELEARLKTTWKKRMVVADRAHAGDDGFEDGSLDFETTPWSWTGVLPFQPQYNDSMGW